MAVVQPVGEGAAHAVNTVPQFLDAAGTPSLRVERRFHALYDYYYPKSADNILSMYRVWFDRNIFAEVPHDKLGKQDASLRQAVRGEPRAFRAFVRSEYRDAAGEFGENWHYECVLLLLVLGDEVFAPLIGKEDARTIQIVREALDLRMDWQQHPFPLTQRTLTAYGVRVGVRHGAGTESHIGGKHHVAAADSVPDPWRRTRLSVLARLAGVLTDELQIVTARVRSKV